VETIVDYVLSAQDTFGERPLGRVDSLVLSWLAYLHLPLEAGVGTAEGALVTSLDDWRLSMVSTLHNRKQSSLLFSACALSRRFADMRACLHVDEVSETEGKQFSATTFRLSDGSSYVAFRGTDNTLVGWKENFSMAFSQAIPAQRAAAAYLAKACAKVTGPVYVGGHSKGGNLAVYATCTATDEVRVRISRCFTHDGPGFLAETLESPAWHADDVAIDKTVPEESVVGMLFEKHEAEVNVVKSTSPGIMQHSPFGWCVEGNDFKTVAGMGYETYRLMRRFNDWLRAMTPAERERVAQTLAWLVDVTGESTLSGIISSWDISKRQMQVALDVLPASEREFLAGALSELAATLLLGSKEEIDPDVSTPEARFAASERRIDDITAHFNSHLSRLDRMGGA